jgi:hypothetical protein
MRSGLPYQYGLQGGALPAGCEHKRLHSEGNRDLDRDHRCNGKCNAKTYTDFTENTSHTSRVASGRIAAAGTLVLRLYYDRNVYSVCLKRTEANLCPT